jgi:hypothetical protein
MYENHTEVSETDVEDYGVEESAVNHRMEVIIGSRVRRVSLNSSVSFDFRYLLFVVENDRKFEVNYRDSKFTLIPTVNFTVIYR